MACVIKAAPTPEIRPDKIARMKLSNVVFKESIIIKVQNPSQQIHPKPHRPPRR